MCWFLNKLTDDYWIVTITTYTVFWQYRIISVNLHCKNRLGASLVLMQHWDSTSTTLGQHSCNIGTTLMQHWDSTRATLGQCTPNNEEAPSNSPKGEGKPSGWLFSFSLKSLSFRFRCISCETIDGMDGHRNNLWEFASSVVQNIRYICGFCVT